MKFLKRQIVKVIFGVAKIYWSIFKPVSVGVRVIVRAKNNILLVKHSYRPGYYLPGGGVHRREDFIKSAKRELWEETGIEALDAKLFSVYRNVEEKKNDCVIVYEVCLEDRVDPKIDEVEIIESEWVDMASLAEAKLARFTKQIIGDYLKFKSSESVPII